MSEPPRTPPQPPSTREQAEATIAEFEQHLRSGRAPRGRQRLVLAIRVLREAKRWSEATRGLSLLSCLDLRRGDTTRALTAARSALRLARQHDLADAIGAAFELAARAYSAAGNTEQAERHARQAVEAAERDGAPQRLGSAQRRLALTLWSAGKTAEALTAADAAVHAEPAPGEALDLYASLLLRAGCPTEANRILTGMLRESGSVTGSRLLARGSSWLVLGRPDRAARDFRRARKLAREIGDRRAEAEAILALATAETSLAAGRSDSRLAARAAAAADRAKRRARAFSAGFQAALETTLQQLDPKANPALTVKDAARRLVELAQGTESAVVAAACLREGERLAGLRAEDAPYHSALFFPLELES